MSRIVAVCLHNYKIFLFQGTIRLDTSFPIKTQYSSVVGEDVVIPVDVPVIANPAPLKSKVTWYGPTESNKVTSKIIRRDADYKYNIRGSISIDNEQHIGNYTMLYDGKEIITIIIHAIKGLSFSFLFSFIFLFSFLFCL